MYKEKASIADVFFCLLLSNFVFIFMPFRANNVLTKLNQIWFFILKVTQNMGF